MLIKIIFLTSKEKKREKEGRDVKQLTEISYRGDIGSAAQW